MPLGGGKSPATGDEMCPQGCVPVPCVVGAGSVECVSRTSSILITSLRHFAPRKKENVIVYPFNITLDRCCHVVSLGKQSWHAAFPCSLCMFTSTCHRISILLEDTAHAVFYCMQQLHTFILYYYSCPKLLVHL